MNNAAINKEFKRLQNLKSNKGRSEAELYKNAQINIQVREFSSNPIFTDENEQKLAENKFKEYLKDNEIESISEIDTLSSLIFNEIFELRLQKEINKLASEQKIPPEKLTKQLTDIQNQKITLRKKLGIDKEEEDVNELTGLETLKKRFKDYINAHKNEFTITDSAGKLLLLRRRVKDFDVMEHPWFAGRWLFNYEILKDVKDGKLSKEDAWRYLSNASDGGEYKPAFDKKYCTDYIDYCLKHWTEITEHIKK